MHPRQCATPATLDWRRTDLGSKPSDVRWTRPVKREAHLDAKMKRYDNLEKSAFGLLDFGPTVDPAWTLQVHARRIGSQ